MKGSLTMSNKEVDQIDIFERLMRKDLKQKQAGKLLHLSVRQIKRKLRDYRNDGASSLIHKGRGKKSNNFISQEVMDKAIETVKDKYWDFSPTLAHEKLTENHNFNFSVGRLRVEMIDVGLWKPKKRKQLKHHELRERRACFGELIQLDGSPHDWFEGRAPRCNLNVAVDDATGIPVLEFSNTETTQGYFSLLQRYFEKYGLPLAIYADKHSIFQVNTPTNLDLKKPKSSSESEGLTQFGRALMELGIDLIPANSPQAKGRVEKINSTLQNRLVKEMRLRNISSIQEANQYLPEFASKYADRFSVSPRSKVDMHRQVSVGVDLTKVLCTKEVRVLSKTLTCQYLNYIYQIKTKRSVYALRGTKVTIYERFDGNVTIWDSQDKQLEYTTIRKIVHKPEISAKELNWQVDAILVKQAQDSYQKRNPWESEKTSFEGPSLYYRPMGAV